MSPGELAVKFQAEFNELVDRSMQAGVPMANVILVLEDRLFELRAARLAMQQEMAAREMQSKIVAPNGMTNR